MIKWALAVVLVLNISAFLSGFAYLGPRIDGSIIYSDAIAHLAPDDARRPTSGITLAQNQKR